MTLSGLATSFFQETTHLLLPQRPSATLDRVSAKPVRLRDGTLGILVDAQDVHTLGRLSEAYALIAEVERGPEGAAFIEELRTSLACRRSAARQEVVDVGAHALATGRLRIVEIREEARPLSEPAVVDLRDLADGGAGSAQGEDDEWIEFAFVDEDGALIEDLRYELEPVDAELIEAASTQEWPIRYDDLGTKFALRLVEVPEDEDEDEREATP